ncbi:MAG: Lrp/AsnC family transcriptional regulator [Clostridia bacterium]|nr:Lrp/AsnC family transcriptional regulator [Clostridia bacterium]
MDNLKTKLVKLLSENARYTFVELAQMLCVSQEEVATAVAQLEKDGVIVKYSAIINNEMAKDKGVQALIEVKVAPQKLNGFDFCAEEIYNFPEVRSLYLMSGGFDLAIFVDGKDITDIAKFVSEKLSIIDGIVGVATHFVLKTYKIEGQLTRLPEKRKREIFQA